MGYIGRKNAPAEYFERVIKWLAKSEKRSVEIYVGIITNPYLLSEAGIKKRVEEVAADFKELLKDTIYASGTTDRIWLSAVVGLHCKFALCCTIDVGGQLIPQGGVFGSSNLTQSALMVDHRLELDLFIAATDPLLEKFAQAIKEIIDEAEALEVESLGREFRERTFYAPALCEAQAEAKADSMREVTHYINQGMNRAEREARMQSDDEQEISSWKPGRKN